MKTGLSSAAVYPRSAAPPPRTLWQILLATAEAFPQAPAIDDEAIVLDYESLLRSAGEAGGRLAAMGIGAGDRVGVRVSSGTANLYVSVLAVLSVGAAYVPVDVDDPDERAALVWSAAGVCAVITDEGVMPGKVPPAGGGPRQPGPDDDAWIIFTSGTTGTPKGVAVTHASAAAFVDAEAGLFLADDPLRPGDRVMAGLSVAFDASCEEMWLAWRHGACLVPAHRSVVKAGAELAPWIVRRRISVVSTVPTLVSLWPAEALRGVRLLILGGEACPDGLADRLTAWDPTARDASGLVLSTRVGGGGGQPADGGQPGERGRVREVWNTYGPTEGTVVSCAARLSPGQPVRIGLPLAGWRLAVVGAGGQPVRWGETGELVIGGAGVARYLDPARDAEAFRPAAALGPERAYRTGDLVRAEPEGLVFVGRADSQVKIRGYRVELSEIENVLMRLPGVRIAAVTTYEPRPGLKELAGYYSLAGASGEAGGASGEADGASGEADGASGEADGQGPDPDRRTVGEYLRTRLPRHMVPAFLEELPEIPMLPSGKADRKSLPKPGAASRVAGGGPYAEPGTPTEKALASALSELLGLPRVSADSQFFDDLGLSSLMVAHFCTQVRERGDAPPVAAEDVYRHPTIRSLAAAIGQHPPAAPAPVRPDPARVWRAGTAGYLACGAAQLLIGLIMLAVSSGIVTYAYDWVSAYSSLEDLCLRSLAAGSGGFALACAAPIGAKWLLMGRFKPDQIKVWTLPYLRFWLVRRLMALSPLSLLFPGTPVYSMYLRLLGARVGRGSVIQSRTVPVCTDMLEIGEGTLIRVESSFTGYRADGGIISTGPVRIGSHALIGEHTVLDIGTSVGDGSQLGHTSSLQEGQAVPDGQRWHGSPAQPTDVDYQRVESLPPRPLRRALSAVIELLFLVFAATPLTIGASVWVLAIPRVAALSDLGPAELMSPGFYEGGLAASTALFLGSIMLGIAIVVTVPRILRRCVTPGRAYPLASIRHSVYKTIERLTNLPFFLELLGDSSYVTGYLRLLGYRMPDFEQTGSNFGADLEHKTPFGVEIGRGTTVADGTTLINADYSATSFRVMPLSIGRRNFIGNAVAYPAGGRTGDNCLIATKAMVPLDGPVRADTGLLGSPSFPIPRSATSDPRFDQLRTGPGFGRRLRAKNRHNLRTMGLFLAIRWLHTAVVTLFALGALELFAADGVVSIAGLMAATMAFSFAFGLAVERGLMRFRSLRPRYCSIYDPYFWWHERYWKLLAPFTGMFDGTPFKSLIWRAVGVRIGKRVFDDGCSIPERTLVTIGDYCTLGAGSHIQCHSMEDGVFKADRTVVESGATIGTGAFVHYGVTIGEGARLQPDSFLMKGEKVPAGQHWGGNPARPL